MFTQRSLESCMDRVLCCELLHILFYTMNQLSTIYEWWNILDLLVRISSIVYQVWQLVILFSLREWVKKKLILHKKTSFHILITVIFYNVRICRSEGIKTGILKPGKAAATLGVAEVKQRKHDSGAPRKFLRTDMMITPKVMSEPTITASTLKN